MVRIFRQRGVALKADGNNHSLTRLNLLQVADRLVINVHLRSQHDNRHACHDERQRTVLQLACGIRLRMDIRNLLQLQRALQCNGIVQAASQKERVLAAAILTRKNLNLVNILQHLVNLLRNKGQAMHQLLRPFCCQSAAQTAYINRQHQHRQKLRCISLRRSNSNLRSCIGINNLVCLTRNRAAHHVRHSQRACAQALRLAQCCQRIARFAALADNNRQAVAVNQRITIAELARDIHLNRHTRQLLQIIFADDACMISSAAGHNENLVDITQLLARPVQLREADGFRLRIQAAGHRIAHSLRLLINLLQHKMLKAALFRSLCVPVDLEHLLAYRRAVDILHPNVVSRHRRNFAIAHNKGAARMIDNRRNIRSDKILTLAQADNQRIILLRADNLVRLVLTHHHQTVGALHQTQHSFYGFLKITVILICQQMRYNLTVGFRQELMALSDKLLLQRQIVFDNAVMHNHEAARVIGMRMRVAVRRTAMRRPARMTNAHGARRHIAGQLLAQCVQTAHALVHADFAIFINGDTGRVISTIFQLAHAIKQEGSGLVVAYIAHNSTHN